jgi:hypothetical protein
MSSPSPSPLTMKDCILRINNDGVSLLRSGRNKAAMFRLARCLAIMKDNVIEGEKEVAYRYIRSSIPVSANTTTIPGTNNFDPRYIFMSPIEAAVVSNDNGNNDDDDDEMTTEYSSYSSSSSNIDDTEKQTCKLLSIVLFNLSLAHHLHALDIKEQIIQVQQQQCKYKYKNNVNVNVNVQNDDDDIYTHQYQEVRSILDRALRLYELCHSSLVFTNSGILCSDLSLAVVVTNNVGEIHKELHQKEEQEQCMSQQEQCTIHQHQQPKEKQQRQECSRTALACSQQLVQIFMFFTANGESEFLEGFGEILSNAIAMLNGPQVVAAAA